MARVITYSTTFPSYHPLEGQSTYFVEKFLNSIDKNNYFFSQCNDCGWMGCSSAMEGGGQIADTGDYSDVYCPKCSSGNYYDLDNIVSDTYYIGKFKPKYHTIRQGNRWKVGDYFSPRIWSGKPYNSKQIILSRDIEIKKVYPFAIFSKENKQKMPKECTGIFVNNKQVDTQFLVELAQNDGLDYDTLLQWFKYPSQFYGQIICWNENINY